MKKIFKMMATVLILTMLSTILLTGCGGSNNESQEPAESEEEQATESSTEEPVAAEKLIRMSVSGTAKVDAATGNDGGSTIALTNLYDTLVFPETDGSLSPSLAESWEVSEDGLTYTFKLRQGVKFHDGSDMTASDIAFTIERLKTIGEGYAYLFGDVEEGIVVDDYTVEIKLSKPVGPFLLILPKLYIVSEDAVMNNLQDGPYGEYGDFGKTYLLDHDAGSGPYTVSEVKQQDYIEAVKFDEYWGGWDNEDAPERIRLVDQTEASTVRTMISNQELEIVDEWQSSENINAMLKTEGVTLGVFTNQANQNFYYNTKLAPTDDVYFRKAISHLFDYDVIANNILVDTTRAVGPVPATVPGAKLDLPLIEYDIEKAKEYLEQSKYKDNLDDYPIEMTVNTAVADQEKIALAFQAAAKELGITVNISKAPWISIQEQVATIESTPNMLSMSNPANFLEAGAVLMSRYHSSSAGTWEQGEWLMDSEIDAMIEDSLAIVDEEERFKAYDEIQQKIYDICPTAWMTDNVQRHVYQDYIYWPVAEMSAQGESITLPYGYAFYFKEFKVMK